MSEARTGRASRRSSATLRPAVRLVASRGFGSTYLRHGTLIIANAAAFAFISHIFIAGCVSPLNTKRNACFSRLISLE